MVAGTPANALELAAQSSTALPRRGQSKCNFIRTEAAKTLVDWLATAPITSGHSGILILGDLNSYAKQDPIPSVITGPDGAIDTETTPST